MQVHPNFDRIMHSQHIRYQIAYLLRRGQSDCIRKRDLRNAVICQQIAGRHHFVDVPCLSIGIAERH